MLKKSKKKPLLDKPALTHPRVLNEEEVTKVAAEPFTLASVANILETLRVYREKLKWEKKTTKRLKAKLWSRNRTTRARLGITTLPRN